MLRLLIGLALVLNVPSLVAGVVPLTAKEISLMLRSGYSSQVVLQELANRKFADTFDSSLEKEFVKAGANQSLIDALRSGSYQLSPTEIASAKDRATLQTHNEATASGPSTHDGQAPIGNAPANPAAAIQQGGTMYEHLKDDLVYWHEGSLVPIDDEALQKKKFYLLFFSAVWSKGGRQITPRLVDYYNRVEPQHPEFEVVFFSLDRSSFAMENYITQTNMPWPVVAYDKRNGKAGAIQGNLVNQVPRLILAEASGKVLSESGDDGPSFDKVLADLDKVLAVSK